MKKTFIIILSLLLVVLSGCSSPSIEKANEYLELGKYGKAEKMFNNLIANENSEEAYEGLISLYDKTNQIEKLRNILGESIELGYTKVDKDLYIKVFDYYKGKGDTDAITQMLTDEFSKIELPDEIYIEYYVRPYMAEDMELIDVFSSDINNDNRNEIIFTIGKRDEYVTGSDMYKEIKMMVIDNKGNVVYEKFTDNWDEVKPVIHILDFTGDKLPELYYEEIYFAGNNQYSNIQILDFADGIRNIYSEDRNKLNDIVAISLENNLIKVFSQNGKASYIISTDEEINPYDPEPIRLKFMENIVNKGPHGIGELKTIVNIMGLGDIIIDYEYSDGYLSHKDFAIKPKRWKKIVSSKTGEDYDTEEYAKNLILGIWSLYYDGMEYGIKVREDTITEYIVESEILDEYNYKIIDCDEGNSTVTIETQYGNYIYEVDYQGLTITAYNGHKSNWTRKQ